MSAKVKVAKRLARKVKAKGEPPRTARIRYIEPPHKVTGNPFVAVRVPRELLAAYRKYCKAEKMSVPEAVRVYMASVTGWEFGNSGDE